MKFLKYFALLALASVPLLLIDRKNNVAAGTTVVDDDDIFERELRVD